MTATYDRDVSARLIVEAREDRLIRVNSTLRMTEQIQDERARSRALADQLEAAGTRIQELLAVIVRVTNETPYPDEIKGWTEQRAKLMAEVGTLKATVAELTRQRDATESTLRSALREALSCWRYPQATAEEKARKDEIWSMAYPIDHIAPTIAPTKAGT